MIKGEKVNNNRKERERDLSDKNRFEILLEDIRHEFRAVGEGHGILLHEIRKNNKESEQRDKELEHMIKFSAKVLHEKIDNVEVRLTEKIGGVDKRLINVERDVGVLKQDVGVLKQDVKSIDNRLMNVEQKLDKVIERQDKQEIRQDKQEVRLDGVYHKVFAEEAGF